MTSKRAVDLTVGDVVVDPNGGHHKITEWVSYPHISIGLRTDSGLSFEVPWLSAMSDRCYEVTA